MANRLEGPRSARPDELPALLSTVDQVHRVSRGKPPSIAREWAHIYNDDNMENILIFKDGDIVPASVGIWINEAAFGDAELRVGGINCLATLPEYRRHGLGSQLMRAANRHMLERGCHVGLLGTLITGWYQKLGWEQAGVSLNFVINRGNVRLLPELPSQVRMEVSGEDAIDDVVMLRNSDRLGGLREADSFRALYRTKGGNMRFILAKSGGATLAYLMANDTSVREWGGAPEVVAGLIRAWFEQTDNPEASSSGRDESHRPLTREGMTVASPSGGHEFVYMMENLRMPFSLGYCGMIYLLDPEEILQRCECGEIGIEGEEDQFTLSHGGDSISLSRRELTKLFFGPEKVSSFADEFFPLPFWQWSIEHV